MKKILTLKLIESNESPKIGDIVRNIVTNCYYLLDEQLLKLCNKNDVVIKPIAISDEEISIGDYYLFLNQIHKANRVQELETYNRQRELYKKIELLPEHFSNDILQLIVDGKLKDLDKIEVEYEAIFDRTNNTVHCNNILDSNSKAIISIPEPISMIERNGDMGYSGYEVDDNTSIDKPVYTEEEVLDLLDKVNSALTYDELKEWFEQNKKK